MRDLGDEEGESLSSLRWKGLIGSYRNIKNSELVDSAREVLRTRNWDKGSEKRTIEHFLGSISCREFAHQVGKFHEEDKYMSILVGRFELARCKCDITVNRTYWRLFGDVVWAQKSARDMRVEKRTRGKEE